MRILLFRIWILVGFYLANVLADDGGEPKFEVLEPHHSNGNEQAKDEECDGGMEATLETKLEGLLIMAESTLNLHNQHTAIFEQFASQLATLQERNSRLDALEAELRERTVKVDALIQQVNTLQLEQLGAKLNDTVQKEIEAVATAEKETMEAAPYDVDMSQFVSLQQLESSLNPESLLRESEEKLNRLIYEVVQEEVANYRQSHASGSCITPLEAAQAILTTFLQADEQVDHASTASIVHEMTSPTYQPPPKPEQLLGNIWWRKYIPQDWERLLPSGWEDWYVGIPSSVYHFLGIKGAATLPPESILDTNIHPGACWPMKGNKGQVTLRLAQPIVPESITVEHASSLLVKDRNSSAPKTIRVVGYPPCARDDDECRGLGFDANRWRVLGTVIYNTKSSSSLQTFPLEPEEEDQGGSGFCSEEVPSCGDDDDPAAGMADVLAQQSSTSSNKKKRDDSVAAVTLEILNNWRNEDYTCIYRVRLHGQPKKASPPSF